jgi:hypothetical protein
MTVFRDPTAKWAGEEVGGIRVSHLSHIDGQFKLALRESQKKSVLHTVDPLPDAPAPAEPTADEVAACTDQAKLREWYQHASPERQQQILERKADLENEPGVAS